MTSYPRLMNIHKGAKATRPVGNAAQREDRTTYVTVRKKHKFTHTQSLNWEPSNMSASVCRMNNRDNLGWLEIDRQTRSTHSLTYNDSVHAAAPYYWCQRFIVILDCANPPSTLPPLLSARYLTLPGPLALSPRRKECQECMECHSRPRSPYWTKLTHRHFPQLT